jgi:DNA segregation ATPase FtsK/SpoIIIE-like protein
MTADERTVRANARNEELYRARLKRLEREKTETLKQLQSTAELRAKALSDELDSKLKQFASEHQAGWTSLERDWNDRLGPAFQQLETLRVTADELFPPWSAPGLKNWSPPKEFAQAARFANLRVELSNFSDQMPKDKRLVLPGPPGFELPLCLAYPGQGSLLIETGVTGHDAAIGALNNVILRLLSVAPPGRLNFTVLDPVGLGQNFAGVMHLADYEEQIINSRIWTQSTQIEQKLADLNEHMEKVIQMYLRNEYQSIAEYNEQAGVIAEKYYFLVVADFPANFTETAAKRLLSIAASGARCGVYMLIHWDRRLPLPSEFIPDELRKACVCVNLKENEAVLPGRTRAGAALILDEPPAAEVATEFVNTVGRFSRDSSRVEVPFEHVIPAPDEVWTEDTSSELRVAIGRTGATKLQYLAIGKGTRQHGLVAGKTGSGKSTLFHVMITNLALWCSPEQVEFYLVDFKKGVEFKCYATRRLPHARVVAIESDREFGLSVLQRVDDELKRRGDLFRQLGVQDVAGYKRAGGAEALPRTLLLIDEFQEFFVEDDKIAQTASLLLDRIVRQGRAFGIHVLLGSQTLGGAYTVARTTLGQMVIRIALQCNEADAYLIMDDTNPAPRLLSRPGEGIYNDMAGALEGNSPFQVVWLPEEVRDNWLAKVRERADSNGEVYPGPIVFEGNSPADVRENVLLRAALAGKTARPPVAARLWLGAPNSIKGPTEAVFHRQSGNNLLIVGQRDETVLGLFSIGLLTLAAQYPPGAARFIFLDATPPGTAAREYLEQVAHIIPHSLTVAKQGELPGLMQELAQEMKRRSEDINAESAPPIFLLIHGLQRFGKLRYEEDFGFTSGDAEAAPNPAAILNNLICEGTRLGFHVLASCDSYNNVARFLSRKALSEFEMRVLFQMSVNDSASLIDNPKAGLLGLHRALFYNAQESSLETFRPYALPGRDWIEEAGRALAALQGQQVAKTV